MTVLVCSCGKRLKAPGAVPGRVGRCPACGGTLRVPEATAPSVPREQRIEAKAEIPEAGGEETAGGYALLPASPTLSPSAFVAARPVEAARRADRGGRGLVRRPETPESRLVESLGYPLWDETGLALLAILPPVLWLVSLPLVGILPALVRGLGLLAVVGPFAMGMLVFFGLMLGYTLLFLGEVLITSSRGEMRHPRLPSWDIWEILDGLGRWAWAGIVGFALGGFPALAYWVRCGDVDWLDRIIFAELLALGAAYGLMALVATMLHETAWAANPITVIGAIGRVGWSYAWPCLVAGSMATLALSVLVLAYNAPNPLLAAVGLWAFWVVGLYAAMVVLRVLGLFCLRRRSALGWDRGRRRA